LLLLEQVEGLVQEQWHAAIGLSSSSVTVLMTVRTSFNAALVRIER